MAKQKENHYPIQNVFDRKKTSKYEVADMLLKKCWVRKNKLEKYVAGEATLVIVDKRQLNDKQGPYWVYDIFYPANEYLSHNERLFDTFRYTYEKIV